MVLHTLNRARFSVAVESFLKTGYYECSTRHKIITINFNFLVFCDVPSRLNLSSR